MTCYVDDVEHRFGRMKMCHLWADSLEELYAMVDRIGVQRKWLQKPPSASWVHFDISLTKKRLAIEAGAVLTDKYGPVEHVARLEGNAAKLEQIARIREKFDMARPKKTDEEKARDKAAKAGPEKNGLLDAVRFVMPGYKENGEAYAQHAMITGGWITSYNGIVQYGHPIDLPFNALPHLGRFHDALKAAGTNPAKITQPNMDRLNVSAGKMRINVDCVNDPSIIVRNNPDQAVSGLDGRMRSAMECMKKVVKKNAEHMVAASVLMVNGSLIACDGKLAVEYAHGIPTPQLTLPGDFIEAVLKVAKPLYCFGFSEKSLTFYFEDMSYIRTQLYAEDWPDVYSVLPTRFDTFQPIPAGTFDAVRKLQPFSKGWLFFDEGKIKTDENEDTGSTFELAGVPELYHAVDVERFLHLDGVSEKWDVTSHEERMFFLSEFVRATLMFRVIENSEKERPEPAPAPSESSHYPAPDPAQQYHSFSEAPAVSSDPSAGAASVPYAEPAAGSTSPEPQQPAPAATGFHNPNVGQ